MPASDVNDSRISSEWDWGSAASVPSTKVLEKKDRAPLVKRNLTHNETLDPKIEHYSGLNIKDRAFSPKDMQDHMDGRKHVKLSEIEKNQKQLERQDEDSVVIGVLSSKSAPRTTTKGSSYSIWTISDLDGNSVSLFLFSEAYEEHWKTVEGTILAILNPGVIPANEKGKFSLKSSTEDEVVVLGVSVDFGICKGMTKAGGRCKQAVNKARCHYCFFHISQQFKKAGRGRLALNTTASFGKIVFQGRHGTSRSVSEGTYGSQSRAFKYGGKRSSAISASNLGLSMMLQNGSVKETTKRPKILTKSTAELQNEFLKAQKENVVKHDGNAGAPSFGKKMIAKFIGVEVPKKAPRASLAAKLKIQQPLRNCPVVKPAAPKTNAPKRDLLGELLGNNPKPATRAEKPTKKQRQKTTRVEIPRESAIYSQVRRNYEVPSNDSTTNDDRKHMPPPPSDTEKALWMQKQVAGRLSSKNISSVSASTIAKSKRMILNPKSFKSKTEARDNSLKLGPANSKQNDFFAAFGNAIDPNSLEGQELLARKSINASAYETEEHVKLDGKLSNLSKKEWASEQRQKITEMTVTAYNCHTCKYVLEKPLDKCGTMGHDVEAIRVKKRWFECRNCKTRITLIRARTPTAPCRKCNSMEWQTCSMYREKKSHPTEQKFLPRGEKQVNSLRLG